MGSDNSLRPTPHRAAHVQAAISVAQAKLVNPANQRGLPPASPSGPSRAQHVQSAVAGHLQAKADLGLRPRTSTHSSPAAHGEAALGGAAQAKAPGGAGQHPHRHSVPHLPVPGPFEKPLPVTSQKLASRKIPSREVVTSRYATLQASFAAGGFSSLPSCVQAASETPSATMGNAVRLAPEALNFRGVGRPLPQEVLQKMEAALGGNFSDVRVHEGPAAQALGALAFTRGSDLYFAPGQYNPSTPSGQRLLGHELAHVLQQKAGRVRNPFPGAVALVQDPALEAEADRLGAKAASYVMPVQRKARETPAELPSAGSLAAAYRAAANWAVESQTAGHANTVSAKFPASTASKAGSGAESIQPYRVLGSDKLYERAPAKRPWFGYPYAVVGRADFNAQTLKTNMTGGYEFLARKLGKDEAYIRTHSRRGLSLRVSDDNKMAIEDSDLNRRQPKVFYATNGVLAAANRALETAGSKVRLKLGGERVTVLTGWYSQEILYSVLPQRVLTTLKGGTRKVPLRQAPQNCNAMAGEVMGQHYQFGVGWKGGNLGLTTANLLGGNSDDGVQNEQRIRDYLSVTSGFRNRRLEKARANQFAHPEVGDAFMIGTLGKPISNQGGMAQILDYESGEVRSVGWPYHFGGVVAVSGRDRVTLENYARGDNRENDDDPRWYFQMYGDNYGQTFYDFHKAKKEYANPITVNVRNPRNKPLPPIPSLGPVWYPSGETITLM